MAPRLASLTALVAAATLTACAAEDPGLGGSEAGGSDTSSSNPSSTGSTAEGELPRLQVRRVATGLSTPWDVAEYAPGRLLVTERDALRLSHVVAGKKTPVRGFADPGLYASSEVGLMSVAVDPRFERNRRIYVCTGWSGPDGPEVRVLRYRYSPATNSVDRRTVLVRGIESNGVRHGGCRLLIDRAGSLLVGTGDGATESTPQDRTALAGKVLRLDRNTGAPWPTNPWPRAASRAQRYVFTYGHRNVQGLAQRRDRSLWSVEHGTAVDDEVNRLAPGRNFGWNPGPGYDESRPMTDHDLPGTQTDAAWSSGDPTLATSGAAWVPDQARWGRLRGTLAIAMLKSTRVDFQRYDARGRYRDSVTPEALTGHGRLRSVVVARNGDLLITTADGSDDAVLRVSPRRVD